MEGEWVTGVVDSLMDCIAERPDPLDRPWRDLSWEELTRKRVKQAGELIPICWESLRRGTSLYMGEGTQIMNGSCRITSGLT